MIDRSHHPFKKNMRLTAEVVEYPPARGVNVEEKLGVLAGVEDEVSSKRVITPELIPRLHPSMSP
jgi:fructose-bisphosphate aldolase class II